VRTKQQRVKDSVKLVLGVLNPLDPYGLEPGEMAPWDEYDLEAAPMVSILLSAGEITAEQVDAIWTEWFDEPLSAAVSKRKFERFVRDINALELPDR
jgi:hypothetical protein